MNYLKIKTDRSIFNLINRHYTFNYTPTFDRFFENSNLTNFLHGKINSNKNEIVLGINEIPNNIVDKKYFIPFTKYFQKLNNNTDYNFLKEFEKKTNLNYIIFFYGHSLDKSDEDYINEVFDFITNLNSKIKKIVIVYHSETSKSKLLVNLLNIRGKKDVLELMRQDILIFTLIDSIEFKKELKRDISIISKI